MRLIDADALINELYKEWNNCEIGNATWTWIREVVRDQPSVPTAPRWVRCEDELPKEDGDYLNYYADGYCAVNHWSKGWGWMYDEEAVRYWMPLPEPPQEVQE